MARGRTVKSEDYLILFLGKGMGYLVAVSCWIPWLEFVFVEIFNQW